MRPRTGTDREPERSLSILANSTTAAAVILRQRFEYNREVHPGPGQIGPLSALHASTGSQPSVWPSSRGAT